MEYLIEFLMFFGKVLTLVLAFLAIVGFLMAQSIKSTGQTFPSIEITKINDVIQNYGQILRENIFSKKENKEYEKKQKENAKAYKDKSKPRLFVLDFVGDIKATAVKNLRLEITSILQVATPNDQILAKITSPGGMVHTYGLAASQLLRIRSAKIPMTVAVDTVAASGGYMMACTADKIIAAPFAILGSIGVLAQVPNLHRFLKKHDIDYEEFTAGDYKRTISMLGPITEKGKEKFKEQIEDTHLLFKQFVKKHRPIVDIDRVSTGEPWFGEQAMDIKLIDQICTSDEYLLSHLQSHEIYLIKIQDKKGIGEKIASSMGLIFNKIKTSLFNSHFQEES